MTASPHRPAAAPSAAEIAHLLAQADALRQTDPQRAGALYARVRDADPANLHAHNAIERLGGRDSYARWMRVNCAIHPDDDIFRFFATYPGCLNPVRDYLADGWRTLSELMVLLERLDAPLLKMARVLEFAAGYGRFTRHLARVLPGRVTCTEVLPGACDFLAGEFDVATAASTQVPEDLELPGRYDLVFVLSLFTHLPVAMWARWLKRLVAAVEPGGILLFTVHSEDAVEDYGFDYEADGTRFLPSSESPALGAEHYGTTFATEAVVLAQVRSALGREPALVERRAFWLAQDAVAVRV